MGILGDIPLIGDLFSGVKDLVSEAITDKDKRLEINFKLQELEDKANERLHEQMMGQISVNTEEAKHASIFVAGWRPAVGWIGAISLGYSFMLNPLMEFTARMFGYDGQFPELPMEYIMTIMAGMLGFGGLRTIETVKGVARDSITQTTKTPNSTTTTTVEVKSGEPNVGVVTPTIEVKPTKKKGGLLRKVGKLF